MQVGEIWSYYKHRKGLLFVVLLLAIVLGGVSCKVLSPTEESRPSQSQALDNFTPGIYNNTLNIKLVNKSEAAACQLNFGEKFRKVSITTSADELWSETYVRIFDANGKLLASEYSTVDDVASTSEQIIYRFSDTPKAYTIDLTTGAVIEIQARKARFYSNLTGVENHYFDLDRAVERYIVTDYGIRKEGWDDQTGNEVMYSMLRRYLIPQIEQYRDTTAQEILDNKDLDVVNKSRILLAYYALNPDDQTLYAEFAELLKHGKAPEITERPDDGPETGEDEVPDDEIDTYPPMDYVENPNLVVEQDSEESYNEIVDIDYATIGGGNNVAYDGQEVNETKRDTENEVIDDNNETSETIENIVDPLSKQSESEDKVSEKGDSSQETLEQSSNDFIIWAVLGGIVVILLIKFIFDHYVR